MTRYISGCIQTQWTTQWKCNGQLNGMQWATQWITQWNSMDNSMNMDLPLVHNQTHLAHDMDIALLDPPPGNYSMVGG